MKKHYIVVASIQEEIKTNIEKCIEDNILPYYNCELLGNKGYRSIYELWDLLDSLSLQQQANTLVIFDPGIYTNIPVEVSSREKATNYWHDVYVEELFPWYELVLRYPLVTAMFLTMKEDDQAHYALFGKEIDPFCYIDLKGNIVKQLEDNIDLFFRGLKTWFDPFGLRDMWRAKVLQKIFENSSEQSDKGSEGSKTLYCVEDEMDFALFNAYTAYKFGCNVYVISSYRVLCWAEKKQKEKNSFLIRDIDLRFPDFRGDGVRTRETMKKPNGVCSSIKKDNRLIVSSQPQQEDVKWIQKPIDSLYDIADKFEWEDTRMRYEKYQAGGGGNHSAPYLNMQLCDHLIKTAQRATDSFADKVFRALLYMDAYMILNNMAEMTSMHVLKESHLSELEFVLSFMGIDKNQPIKSRRKDIEKDIDHLIPGKTKMKRSFLISFWDHAKTIYKNYEQFYAADSANIEAMKRI